MSGWTKLFSSIVTSSIWCEDDATLRVWVAMLATADSDGVVEGSIPGFANMARVSVDSMRKAVNKLISPDPDSRTPDHEGRRIEAFDGGWRILNYSAYREKGQAKDGSKAPAMRKYRERKRDMQRVATPGNALLLTVTGEPEERREKREAVRNNRLPALSAEVVEVFTYWQTVMDHPDSRLGKDRVRVIEARLKEGYTVEQIKAAVDGCKASAWHMGENERRKRYDGLELICRSAEKLDAFRAVVPVKAPDVPLPPAPTAEQQEASRREWERIRPTLGVAK
jgi:hypothetical protein